MKTATLIFDPTGWLEINYTQTIQLPAVAVPAKPALFDADGNEVQAAEPERTEAGGTQTITLQSTSYHPTQLELINADCATHGVVIAGDDAQAIAEWVADYVPPAPAPAPVPQVLTARQAKLVLHNAGLLDDVDASVAASDKATQIEWEYAAEIRRDWPTLAVMAGALGMTDAQLDGMFTAGALL